MSTLLPELGIFVSLQEANVQGGSNGSNDIAKDTTQVVLKVYHEVMKFLLMKLLLT